MGCASSKPPVNATAIVPTPCTPTTPTVDRYCRCVDQDQTKSFVCPVCRKIRLDVKKDVRQAQRNQRKSSLKPRNVRHRAPSEDSDPDPSSPHRHRSSSKKKNFITRSNRGTNRDDKNPQAHSNSNSSSETGSSNSDDYDSADQEYYPPSYDAANDPNSSYNQYQSNPKKDKKKDKSNTTVKRQSSLQRRSAAFWAVSHKVQQMVDITKFYEMALRKLFRDYDIDNNGFIDAPELCQLIANATGNAGIYQPLTMQEAELFLLSSIKAKRRKDTNVHDVVLEENKFIKTMMKYGHGNTVGNSNEAEEKLFSSSSAVGSSGSSSSTISAQQRMTKKINQFVTLAKRRLERRAVSLYQLFHSYCGTHYVNTRNEWIKDVVDINDLHHMMCDVANGRTDEEPSRSDVKQFIESMDVNGDNHLHVSEFLTYMMRGLVQSQASMIRFSERSSMHHAVCCFLMNVDARHRKDDDHISLDNDQMEDLLHEVRGILTSNDLLGVAAAMSGRKSAGRGGLNGLSGWNGGLSREHSNTSSPTNSLTSSYGSVATNDSFDTKMYDAELLKTETREANLMQSRNNAGGDGGGPQFSPLQRKMRRTQQSFIEDRRRNNHETNTIRSKSKESTRLRLQERERTRVLQRFNPEAIRQVAEQTTDELTKSRLLAIIGDQMRQSGESGGSPQHLKQQKALEELNSAATEVGSGYSRVRRLSGSKRNAQRIRTEAGMVQDRFNKESEMLYQEQHEHMEERLKQRRERLLQNLRNIGGNYNVSATGSTRRGNSGAPMQSSSGTSSRTADPFAGIEAFREEHRRKNQVQRQQQKPQQLQPNVIRTMDLSSSVGEQ